MKHQPLAATVYAALMLGAASCDSPDTTLLRPSVPAAAVKKSPSCALAYAPGPVFGDDWCEGGNWWWYVRADFTTTSCAKSLTIRADVITSAGNRVHFGTDNFLEQYESPSGTLWVFELQGIAPREPVGNEDRGFPQFRVEVFEGSGSVPIGTFDMYSDIQLNPNTEQNRPFCDSPPWPDPGYPNGQHPKD